MHSKSRSRSHAAFLGAASLALCSLPVGGAAASGLEARETGETDDAAHGGDQEAANIVVTGNRGSTARTVATSPVPIDVVSGQQLRDGGKPALVDALVQSLPSFNAPAIQATGRAVALIRSGSLRGLGPDRTLFLVNGHRRHAAAVLSVNGLNIGSPVDLDFIPSSGIERVEVLRSAASAQYGSDAIGGVVNIILRKDEGFRASSQFGQTYEGDGELYSQELNYGTRLGNAGGFLNLSLVAKYRGVADRSENVTGRIYNLLPNGAEDPREATAERHRYRHNGAVPATIVTGSYNAELPLGDDLSLYSFATLGYREGWSGYTPRLPRDIVSLPEIYPDGFYPKVDVEEWDGEVVLGLRGQANEWHWDISASFAHDRSTDVARETLNPSLGPTSPTSFLAQKTHYSQAIAAVEVRRSFDIGLGGPLDIAFGGDIRHETYKLIAGDPLNVVDGGYIIPSGFYAGRRPSPYLQGVQFVAPNDAGSAKRNVYSGFLDLGLNPTSSLYLGVAGRFQHYDDSAGSRANVKLSARYEFAPGFSLRGSAGTGFRAPSLQQQAFQQTNAAIQTINGVEQFVLARTVRTDNPYAIALGAKPLQPEDARDYSVGLALAPARNLTITADFYQIWVDDRVTLVSQLNGPAVDAILGFPPNYTGPANRLQYFANALDTKTTGFDVVASYDLNLASAGSLKLTAAYNYNKTDIRSVRDTPGVLLVLGSSYEYFNRQSRSAVLETPRDKIVLNANWALDRLNVNTRVSRYGRYTEFGTVASGAQDSFFPERWVADLAIGYRLTENVKVLAGANNLFDAYPRKRARNLLGTTGFGAYGANSPFGTTGGFYYARIDFSL